MMKGYYVPSGYYGWVGDHYMLFPTEREYIIYIKEVLKDGQKGNS